MTLVIRPGFAYDTDASNYIDAVEVADGSALETKTRYAINNFVIGCKSDGIWSAMKASCILAGARTLAGALVPLVGAAPTKYNFVSGDYDRKTGLVGDGSTKYLDSNRAENADPLNSLHTAVYLTSASPPGRFIISGADNGNASSIYGTEVRSRNQSASNSPTREIIGGFAGISRSAANAVAFKVNGVTGTATSSSLGTNTTNFNLFRSPSYTGFSSNARLAFYSIGESLDLALLDARVTDLINAFGVAIP
jgi:hypothetical protein